MSSGDDWLGDEIDWDDGAEQSSPGAAPPPPRVGLIPGVGPAGHEAPADGGRLAEIRRRRIVALAALGLIFVLALVIPLVVFGGGGGNALETTAPVTTTTRTTSPARTTTQERPTTSTTPTTTTGETLRVTLPAGETLSRGDRGSEVVALQKGLAALGFAAGEPDGVFGATTEAAVIDFQQSNNLTPDGKVGTDTVRLLNSALADQGATG